ncbi:EGF, latrophilin and seven transmembrane domain-containing protein 1-like [Oopsacas minuta]|uniref:EGF, latrophilin and seven transmembrane domain-containing protein 1-like n=1 Tax=Oopsacas minuta TaxID=111878 RepID=A0AAV7K9A4_9METZ|nr:EGF, latrophilin and seven transmembrane domain-containing protein 1-like [Oopsacas minuta]
MNSFIVNVFGVYCIIFCIIKVNSQCTESTCNFGICLEDNGQINCICDTGYTGTYCSSSVYEVYCEATTEEGYQWPKTQTGQKAMTECNSSGSTNLEGTIDRMCNTDGNWEELDLNNCKNPLFEQVEQQLENLDMNDPGAIPITEGMLLAQALVTATRPPSNAIGAFISPSNLKCAVGSLRLLQKSILQKNTVDKDKAINSFGSDWFRTCSNVLDPRNLRSYMSKAVDSLDLTNTLVDSLNGIASDYGGSASTEQIISEQNIYVIGGPIGNPSEEGLAKFPNKKTPDGEGIQMDTKTINYLKEVTGESEVRIGMMISEGLGSIINLATDKGKAGPLPSKFITLGVGGQHEKIHFNSPVKIEFKQSASDTELINSGLYSHKCGYWKTEDGAWAMDGLTGLRVTSGHFECMTSHFTSFSVLINPNPIGNDTSATEQLAISIVTYILSVVSLISLIVSIIILLCLGKALIKKDLYMVHLNFAISLAISLLFFIFGVQTARDNVIACGIIAGILHYFFLTVFSWSLCEAILVLYMLYVLFSPRKIYPYLMILGWGLPVPIVVITVGIRWNNYGVEGQYCWLSTENGTVWSFVGPALTVVFINIFLLVIAITRIFMGLRTRIQEMTRFRQARTVALGTFVLVPVLGIPWIVAVLNFFVSVSLFQWIFVILNTPQGLLFLLLYILNNRELLTKVRRRKRNMSQRDSQITLKENASVYSSRRSVSQKFKKHSTSSIGVKSEIDMFVAESPVRETIPEFITTEDNNSNNENTEIEEQLGINIEEQLEIKKEEQLEINKEEQLEIKKEEQLEIKKEEQLEIKKEEQLVIENTNFTLS